MSSAGSPGASGAGKPKSNDPEWKYAQYAYPNNKNSILCDFCGKIFVRGIYRHKQHLAGIGGNVAQCLKVPPSVRVEINDFIEGNSKSKTDRLAHLDRKVDSDVWDMDYNDLPIGSEPTPRSGQSETVGSVAGARKKPRQFGPIDSFCQHPERGKGPMQTTLENRYKKTERKKVIRSIGRWFYNSGLPFNAVKNKFFQQMINDIGEFGYGLKAPSYHEIREPILKDEVGYTVKLMEDLKPSWAKYGCTIMTDGWTDRKSRSLMNFLINSPNGTWFLKSIDASNVSHTADFLLKEIEKVIDQVGEQHVVQVVTDNASANVAAGRMLMEKRRHIFWTPCAAHCLDLMLEYIGKLRGISSVIIKARAVTRFMYKHTLLNLMRKHTKGRDLVRAGVTRFVTSFLTLQSLHIHKVELRKLFVSAEWIQSPWVKKPEGQHVANTILSQTFWNGVTRALLASQPIVSVLRLVERVDKPPMGYVHQAMLNAIEKIKKSFNNNERDYLPIVKVVEDRWTDHMSHPLHQAACFLNPSIYYEERAKGEEGECRVGQYKLAFLDCVEKMVQDFHIEDKISTDLKAYTDASGTFGKDMAIRQRLTTSALDWWDSYGVATPELRRVALCILGLTCSASDCERNWSTFEHIHTKKRNRLEQKKLNDLVFIQFNQRLKERFETWRENPKCHDPICLGELDYHSEWLMPRPDLDEDLVFNEEDGDNLTWQQVDEAVGASEAFEGSRSRRPRGPRGSGVTSGGRGQPSTSTACPTPIIEEDGSDSEETDEEDAHIVQAEGEGSEDDASHVNEYIEEVDVHLDD